MNARKHPVLFRCLGEGQAVCRVARDSRRARSLRCGTRAISLAIKSKVRKERSTYGADPLSGMSLFERDILGHHACLLTAFAGKDLLHEVVVVIRQPVVRALLAETSHKRRVLRTATDGRRESTQEGMVRRRARRCGQRP